MNTDNGIRLWCNIGETAEVPGVFEMLARLGERLPALSVTVTTSRSVDLPDPLPENVRFAVRPFDIGPSAERFLLEHRPHVMVMTGTDLVPSAISACRQKKVPVVLVNARFRELGRLHKRLTNFWAGTRPSGFARIAAVSEEDKEGLVRRGATGAAVEVLGMLEASTEAPSCDADEVEHLSKRVAARPVWLAAGVPKSELATVETAFGLASGLAHRLLLIVTPASPTVETADAACAHFEAAGWKTARREDAEEPDLDVQVYVADAPGEEGIWYRLAPVTYLGGTLCGAPHSDPFAPAALGSAILHGTMHIEASPWLERLIASGASRSVTSAEDLGKAVSDLISPDRAAQMATLAWDVASKAAATTERAADLVEAVLKPGARA